MTGVALQGDGRKAERVLPPGRPAGPVCWRDGWSRPVHTVVFRKRSCGPAPTGPPGALRRPWRESAAGQMSLAVRGFASTAYRCADRAGVRATGAAGGGGRAAAGHGGVGAGVRAGAGGHGRPVRRAGWRSREDQARRAEPSVVGYTPCTRSGPVTGATPLRHPEIPGQGDGRPARQAVPGQARGAYSIESNGQSRSSHARTAW